VLFRSGGTNRLQEGIRVHARVTHKDGTSKFLPGRITKAGRGGTYEVECEGGKQLTGLTPEDLQVGIEEGQTVEARRPSKVELQCTGLSWNATGSIIATSYGRTDITGWCGFPGAVCMWNIFGKSFDANNPDYVLDHTSCITSVKCHPTHPSLVAAGSFNGEVVLWDLNSPEAPIAISPIIEYSHKEPILDLGWLYDPVRKVWLVVSVGADGKILLWDYTANSFKVPVRGSLLSGGKLSKRQYPLCHGGTAISFSTGGGADSSSIGMGSMRSKWTIIGQEGGGLFRSQTSKLLDGSYLTADSFKTLPSLDEVFTPLKKTRRDVWV